MGDNKVLFLLRKVPLHQEASAIIQVAPQLVDSRYLVDQIMFPQLLFEAVIELEGWELDGGSRVTD